MELVVECVHQLRWFLATKTVARLVMIVTTSLPRCSKPTQFRNQTCSSTLIVRYFSQGCQGSPRGIQVCGLSSTPTGNLGDNEDSDGDVNGPYTQFGCCIEQNRSEVGLVLCKSTGRRENSALGKNTRLSSFLSKNCSLAKEVNTYKVLLAKIITSEK